jgi:putative chitinase
MATLQKKSTGVDVKTLQEQLKAHGFDPGQIDGNFGSGTEAAVIALQKSEGLLSDGIAGPRTLAKLGLAVPEEAAFVIPSVTVAVVSEMFPVTPVGNIKTNLPVVLSALVDSNLSDKAMVLIALATIRAETESLI